jgi:SAM-dependent methyltransferase
MLKSPLTNSQNVRLIGELDASRIVKNYQENFGIDVSSYFEQTSQVGVYQCQESGLKFFYPDTLAGDADFYARLSQAYKGYYAVWKWEHQKVFEYLNVGDKVLEIGCGNGYFLEKSQAEKQIEGVGLDFNPEAIEYGKKIGVKILGEPIESHAQVHTEVYDLVCAFQLFEHVNEVGEFLKYTIQTLKKGGKLAIGVPNNDSYLFKADPYHTLNTPPHHILLWDANSLAYVAKKFNLTLVEIAFQPANRGHQSAAYHIWLKNTFGNNLFAKGIYLLTRWLSKSLPIIKNANTVVAIYQK